MIPDKLVLEHINGKFAVEENLVLHQCKNSNIPTVALSLKQLQKAPDGLFTDKTVACGGISFIKASLKKCGVDTPAPNPYPVSIKRFLGREVEYRAHLKDVLKEIEDGKILFVKPADSWKRFTGFVCDDPRDWRFSGCSKNKPVFVSEPIVFKSEWRVYVVNGAIKDIRLCPYSGDESILPDYGVINEAVTILLANQTSKNFGIDFGVSTENKTLLVELNDGFSLGAYGVFAKDYFDLIVNRWFEMVERSA